MFKRLMTTAIIFGAVATAPPVLAQARCDQRDHVAQQLSDRYMEQLTAGGLQSATAILEIWTSPESGSWTMLVTRPSGISCIVSSGTAWHVKKIIAEPQGVPS